MKKPTTILIVDDEKPIRQWFEYVIRQYDEEFIIAGICSNGEEALHIYEECKPDIIITDIRMPVMDGLELIQSVKERGGSTEFLILSNYDHFEYVKKGLVLGAKDYLLKAETADQEIIEALRNITKACTANKQNENIIIEDSEEIVKALIRDFLHHHAIGREPMQRITNYLDTSFSEQRNLLTFSMDGFYQWSLNRMEDEKKERLTWLADMVRERLKISFSKIVTVQADENEFVLLVEKRSDEQQSAVELLCDHCKKINKELNKNYGCTLSFGIGRPFETLEDMKLSYTEANEAKEYKFYFGPSGVHGFDKHMKDDAARDRCLIKIHELIRSFQFPDKQVVERVRHVLESIFDEGQRGLQPNEAKKLIANMLEMLGHKMLGMLEGTDANLPLIDPIVLFLDADCKEQLFHRIAESLETMVEVTARHLYRYSEATNKIIRYVYENYSQKIEMSQLARLVHLNENYISQLFKKETGNSVTRFLMSVRMDRAKQLLLEKRLKINEIALEVGYTSESHFCTAFKLYYGKSPGHLQKNFEI